MNKKEKLQAKITKYQAELHDIEVKEWWKARPHIAEFECSYAAEYNDEGSTSNYFRADTIILNHEWIRYNNIQWQTFCDHLEIPLYPDEDELSNDSEYYLRDIKDPDNYEVDYPEFVAQAEQTINNPNFIPIIGGV